MPGRAIVHGPEDCPRARYDHATRTHEATPGPTAHPVTPLGTAGAGSSSTRRATRGNSIPALGNQCCQGTRCKCSGARRSRSRADPDRCSRYRPRTRHTYDWRPGRSAWKDRNPRRCNTPSFDKRSCSRLLPSRNRRARCIRPTRPLPCPLQTLGHGEHRQDRAEASLRCCRPSPGQRCPSAAMSRFPC
jgi:hypothetical protein